MKDVIWYDSFADISIPMELLPDELYEFFNNQETGSTLLAVLYDTSMSADETMDAIEEIACRCKRRLLYQWYVGGRDRYEEPF